MSYTPTTWKDGDLVTSAKLNKIEQGIAAGGGSGVPIIYANGALGTLDKTWQEIYDVGCGIIVMEDEGKFAEIITGILYNSNINKYIIQCTGWSDLEFIAAGPDSYPQLQLNVNPGISNAE